jgi:fructan beta-fructosidase
MNRNFYPLTLGVALAAALTACQAPEQAFTVTHQDDSLTIVHIQAPVAKYLLLPIQETADEAKVRLDLGRADDTDMDVRLAVDSVDYYVPFALPTDAEEATVRIQKLHRAALCFDSLKVSDTFDTTNRDKFRPVYHHTPVYGWMNDANGLVYKDGEYHLYFQYNPYGSMWGNMHWGHSVSRDLVRWDHLDTAIARDTLGHIFSGSAIVDKYNDAGYGENALIAFYTSASDEHGQIECMAYSTDNGRTYTKYEGNPILTPFDGLRDFRDPKVFRYEPEEKWVMVVSADKEMRFYSSKNLKDWTYMSSFGYGYGAMPSQFECPDFVQLPVDGNANRKKWALLVNLNPGCLFGGSATEYFVGDFDGTRFTCDSPARTVKWLDYGKDHYATVCFSNTGDRVIAVPWMSNWQYANTVPTQQFRSANALPRELTMYTAGGETYLAAAPVKEVETLRGTARLFDPLTVADGDTLTVDGALNSCNMAFELQVKVTPGTAQRLALELANAQDEKTVMTFDMQERRFLMDRTQSGLTQFSHDFPVTTFDQLDRCVGGSYTLSLYVDRCSVEAFVDGGRIAMTNLVFPREEYDVLRLSSQGGAAKFENLTVYPLTLK